MAPLSRFEGDPAVRAFRVASRQLALAVNADDLGAPELLASSTPARVAQIKRILSGPAGRHAPGPFPFTPLRVRVDSATQRTITACLQNGWVLTKEVGGKPEKPVAVGGAIVTVTRTNGVWRVDSVFNDKNTSCRGVRIAKQRF